MKALILFSFLTLTFSAFAADMPAEHTAAEAHVEATKHETTTEKTQERHPAQLSGQHANDFAVSGASR